MQGFNLYKAIFTMISSSPQLRLLPVGLLFFLFLCPAPIFGATPFPHYPVIAKNVRFWDKIYSEYSTSQAVIHDSNDLSIIYEVLPIFSHRLPGASKVNQPIFKGIKNKYTQILTKLAQGIQPQTREEKRVASLFGTSNPARFKTAASSVRVQIGQKDRFLDGVIQSGAYMDEIKSIFSRQGLPLDLAYLPHVESSFNINAYSKFGASGIWQFTRSTGEQFLNIDYAVDERQDPILASHAAATFLKNNYKLLGNWPLAITAYNYGPAGMLRAQKAHSGYEKIFSDYEQGYFKFASRNFYSEFLAAVQVAKRLEKDPAIQRKAPRSSLKYTLPAYISAQDILSHFNISEQTLKQFNPALRRSVFQGNKYIPKGYTLHLPYTSRHKSLIAKIPPHIYHGKQKPTNFHRVKAGDSAGKIAQKYKVSLKSLRHANNLDKNAAIFVGQNLRIPDSSSKSSQAIRPQKQKTFNQPAKTRIAVDASRTLPLLADEKKQKPQWLNIQRARSVVLGSLGVRNILRTNATTLGTITVFPEESLKLLADWLQVSATELRNLNNFSHNRELHPDEDIKILLNNVSAKQFEEKRFDFHLETEEDFFSAYKIVGVSSYTVKKGDTVWEICTKKFDLPLWLLKKYNANLDFSSLQSSQRLTIPIVKAI
ncbi:LysM repeat-containing protein [Desulfocapsa sulfexigens DSM 10523]|uniref:LysM repeat-containing protein n=2 Tax=Desulfocapsa TaxID=53318 RepID=M1PQH8_DESSD|nr:LysM repeat-containing protein [Desulfocapsa sulfexigens DSM 10523]